MIIRLLTVLAFLCLASAAQAQNNWSAPASACVPADDAAGRYESDIAFVRHLGTNVDPIALTCQMDRFNSGTSAYNLKITYRDSTGTATSASVLARLYRMAIGTATPIQITEVNSNSSAVTGTNTVASPEFNHTFDFEANTYWVRVVIKRANSSQTVILYSLVLDGTAF